MQQDRGTGSFRFRVHRRFKLAWCSVCTRDKPPRGGGFEAIKPALKMLLTAADILVHHDGYNVDTECFFSGERGFKRAHGHLVCGIHSGNHPIEGLKK